MRLSVAYRPLALKAPYRLSFAAIERFDCFFLCLSDGERRGYGEVTPLPGYGAETPRTVAAELVRARAALGGGADPRAYTRALFARAPMTASALMVAMETLEEGEEQSFRQVLARPVPLAALCEGETAQETAVRARALVAAGYRTLKLKVGGGDIAAEIARVGALVRVVANDVAVRVDANQALSFDQAVALSEALEASGAAILEQPFAPQAWDQTAELARASGVALMLDEAIWDEADIARAARAGAAAVKLKLCKHLGLGHVRALARAARQRGLGLVLGNGVQSALGNHLEARLHLELGLKTAAESNGFLKVAQSPFRHRLRVSRGALCDGGLGDPAAAFEEIGAGAEAALEALAGGAGR